MIVAKAQDDSASFLAAIFGSLPAWSRLLMPQSTGLRLCSSIYFLMMYSSDVQPIKVGLHVLNLHALLRSPYRIFCSIWMFRFSRLWKFSRFWSNILCEYMARKPDVLFPTRQVIVICTEELDT